MASHRTLEVADHNNITIKTINKLTIVRNSKDFGTNTINDFNNGKPQNQLKFKKKLGGKEPADIFIAKKIPIMNDLSEMMKKSGGNFKSTFDR